MNAADDGAPGSWRRLVQRDLASLIADALALWAEIRSLDAALDTGAPLSSALEASVQSVRAFPLRPDYHIVWRVSAAILLTYATLTALWYLRSEEHTSELQSLMRSVYTVFCLTKNINQH